MNLTQEQQNIVKACLVEKGVIMANAFAGTGKTTTCLHSIASALQAGWVVLYLVYNRSMGEEARERLSGMLTGPSRGFVVKTAHAFAYAYMRNRIRGQLGNLRAKEIAYAIDCDIPFAIRVLKVYTGFLHSEEDFTADGLKSYVSKHARGPFYKGYTAEELFEAVYQVIALVEEGKLSTPHDHYLKVFVNDIAGNLNHFDLVILDEAQDANPVFIQLLRKLNGRTTLLVGDRHQKIYGFRNTVDASTYFPDARIYYLTESFRFGDNISRLANQVLAFKGEAERVKGRGVKKHNGLTAYISRTNSGVLQKILELNQPVRTERPMEDILRPALSVLYIIDRPRFNSLGFSEMLIDWSIVKAFKNTQEFLEYIEHPECDDKELLSAYSLIRHLRLYGGLRGLREVFNMVDPDSPIVCTTAHSSKGSEYGTVYLKEDLYISPEEALAYLLVQNRTQPPDKDFCLQEGLDHKLLQSAIRMADLIEEEINLIYVAFTRAIEDCHYEPATLQVFSEAKEVFDRYIFSANPRTPQRKPTRGR